MSGLLVLCAPKTSSGDDYGFGRIKFPVLAPEFPAPPK
jgi:hypothetical protein